MVKKLPLLSGCLQGRSITVNNPESNTGSAVKPMSATEKGASSVNFPNKSSARQSDAHKSAPTQEVAEVIEFEPPSDSPSDKEDESQSASRGDVLFF